MKNKRTLTSVFGKRSVMSAQPDDSWPLPSEFIGVEIEVENFRRAEGGTDDTFGGFWTTHSDGSLRNGLEFVTDGPQSGANLTQAIDNFFSSGVSYDTSPRTSVHIHINASDTMGIDDLRAVLLLVYVIEPAIFRWADENRKWCGYCNPLTDMAPSRLLRALSDDSTEEDLILAVRGTGNSDRYFGFNLAAFDRHGTLEFRYFPCVTEAQPVRDWIKLVMMIKKIAVQSDGVAELLSQMNGTDQLRQFIVNNFGDVAGHLDQHMDYEDAAGRVRQLLSMLRLKAPSTLPTAGRRGSSTPSRGFRAFLAKSFPDFQLPQPGAATQAVSPAEEAAAGAIGMDLDAYLRLVNTMAPEQRRQVTELANRMADEQAFIPTHAPTRRELTVSERTARPRFTWTEFAEYNPPTDPFNG